MNIGVGGQDKVSFGVLKRKSGLNAHIDQGSLVLKREPQRVLRQMASLLPNDVATVPHQD